MGAGRAAGRAVLRAIVAHPRRRVVVAGARVADSHAGDLTAAGRVLAHIVPGRGCGQRLRHAALIKSALQKAILGDGTTLLLVSTECDFVRLEACLFLDERSVDGRSSAVAARASICRLNCE